MSDNQLVEAAKAGDSKAFEELVRRYQGMVYSLAYRMVGDPDNAADLSQDAFLNAWRGLGKFDARSSFSTWLYRLTSNACIDFLRREKRRTALSMTVEDEEGERQAEFPDERYAPHRALEKEEARSALERALAALSPEHRQVLLLREAEGLSYARIAQILEVEEGTVKSRLARARLSLRDRLRDR